MDTHASAPAVSHRARSPLATAAGNVRVEVDAEEYLRFTEALEHDPPATPEAPGDAQQLGDSIAEQRDQSRPTTNERPANDEAEHLEGEAPAAGESAESIESFMESLIELPSAVPRAGPAAATAGSAALPQPSRVSRRARTDAREHQAVSGVHVARRSWKLWTMVIGVAVIAVMIIVVLDSGGRSSQVPAVGASTGSGQLGNFHGIRAVLTRSLNTIARQASHDATMVATASQLRHESHQASAATHRRAARARAAARHARHRRDTAKRKVAITSRPTASAPTPSGSDTTPVTEPPANAATSSTSTPTTPSSSSPTPSRSSAPARKDFGYGGLLGSGHAS